MKKIKSCCYWLAEQMGFVDMDETPKDKSVGKFADCKREKKKYKTNSPTENPPVNSHSKRRKANKEQPSK